MYLPISLILLSLWPNTENNTHEAVPTIYASHIQKLSRTCKYNRKIKLAKAEKSKVTTKR